jgi:tudor domain-containing protein 1/4/6/7
VPGAVFAGRHLKMNTFFRVEVEYNIHGEEYLVHLIDYGDKEVISLTNLRPLTPNFCQLPAQALKARLAGVQPKNGDWGMEEVFIFKELVDNKNLYSFVTSITADNVLQLHMIDTSADIDVIISRYLVDRKLAVLAP